MYKRKCLCIWLLISGFENTLDSYYNNTPRHVGFTMMGGDKFRLF